MGFKKDCEAFRAMLQDMRGARRSWRQYSKACCMEASHMSRIFNRDDKGITPRTAVMLYRNRAQECEIGFEEFMNACGLDAGSVILTEEDRKRVGFMSVSEKLKERAEAVKRLYAQNENLLRSAQNEHLRSFLMGSMEAMKTEVCFIEGLMEDVRNARR